MPALANYCPNGYSMTCSASSRNDCEQYFTIGLGVSIGMAISITTDLYEGWVAGKKAGQIFYIVSANLVPGAIWGYLAGYALSGDFSRYCLAANSDTLPGVLASQACKAGLVFRYLGRQF